MNTQHTPGNWIAKTYSTETIRDAVGIYAGSMTLPIVPDIAGRSIEECDANIRLIAAAPELLNALLRIQSRADYGKDNPRKQTDVLFDILELSRDVIAKATGGAA